MADPVATQPPASPPVAAGGQPGPAPVRPVGPDAASLAAKHGGNRGGRPRKDGLVPGSVEAVKADRERDQTRKRLDRARARATLAGAVDRRLPAAPAPGPSQIPAPADSAAGVPWDTGVLQPIFEQLLPALEKWNTEKIIVKAGKLSPPPELLAEIRRDAAWPGPARIALASSGPHCLAKWLNQLGVGAENAPEIIFGTAVASIVASQITLHSKLDRIIAAQRQVKDAPTPKPA